ncbi:unnamed protein product [Urochloa decumbens]|uniref:Uncharacterized protein n=1 Tax=Urochloa decumbens TaxID=240449 RepID=A0ABC8V6U9_9POAL
MDGSCTSVQQLPALQYAAADASPRSNIPDVSSDANGVMSAEAADEGASDGAAAASCIADDSSLGCAAKVNTGSGGGGGGANSDASAAAWSANIGAGGDTSTVEKGWFAWWLVKGATLFDDGVVGAGSGAVAAAVGLPLLLERGEDAEARRGVLASAAAEVGVDGAEEEEDDGEERLALRQPPPTGTLRRTPPLVQ